MKQMRLLLAATLLAPMARAQEEAESVPAPVESAPPETKVKLHEIDLRTTYGMASAGNVWGPNVYVTSVGFGYAYAVVPALQATTEYLYSWSKFLDSTGSSFRIGAGGTLNLAQDWDALDRAPFASLLAFWDHSWSGDNELGLTANVGLRIPLTESIIFRPMAEFSYPLTVKGHPWTLSFYPISFSGRL